MASGLEFDLCKKHHSKCQDFAFLLCKSGLQFSNISLSDTDFFATCDYISIF